MDLKESASGGNVDLVMCHIRGCSNSHHEDRTTIPTHGKGKLERADRKLEIKDCKRQASVEGQLDTGSRLILLCIRTSRFSLAAKRRTRKLQVSIYVSVAVPGLALVDKETTKVIILSYVYLSPELLPSSDMAKGFDLSQVSWITKLIVISPNQLCRGSDQKVNGRCCLRDHGEQAKK
jgi:hypothetical protein